VKSDSDKAYDKIIPVLGNVINVYQALSVYEAVLLKAKEINASKYKPFFFYVHKAALHHAILCLCKLYDKSRRYPSYTVFNLLDKIELDIPNDSFPALKEELLSNLEISDEEIQQLSDPSASLGRKELFLRTLRNVDWISKRKNKTLETCFTFRDKKIAHLEDISASGEKLPDYYPSSEHIEWLADRVYDVCCLAMDIYGVSRIHMMAGSKGISGNTLSVIKKVMDIDFKSHDEMMSWYGLEKTE